MTKDKLLSLIEQTEKYGWTELNLSNMGLTELPSEIGNLTQLIMLDLSSSYNSAMPNQLTGIPSEIGQLSNLTTLSLSRNQLTAVPPEFGLLTSLKELNLSGNELTAVPPEIGLLSGLTWLDLSRQKLTAVPPEIGLLISLIWLHLGGIKLTAIPPEIGQLTSLTRLNLSHNKLTAIPPEIGQLTSLIELDLIGNKITAVPPEIGQLINLTSLDLSRQKLTTIPSEIGQLTSLTRLNLNHNGLTAVPPEIGQLISLTSLHLKDNQLNELPAGLGNLQDDAWLVLGGNPWREPWDELVKGSRKELFAYLRSLQEGTPQYEAKVLLVGEGAVGKTSLLAAFRDEDFVIDRPTTHGIEIKQVAAGHPDATIRENLTLNFWDFGGQEVYRITHQFFFSRHALYLLIWKPREGQKENALEGWLERIYLRVGHSARVLIVATHCNERVPELDYPALQSQYGRILAGHYQIDSADGTGIAELQQKIAAVVANLEHVGIPFNQRWLAARDDLKMLDQTHITYDQVVAVCTHHQLSATDAKTLTGILNTLGQIVYYDSDGLRDFVVLKPEWLTKAIGYILEDQATRDNKGILDHRRLNAIWHDHQRENEARYSPEHFPYFLRLMEEYDVSARLEGKDASLIPQMVPYETPSIPWKSATADKGQLSLICDMEQNPPGLIAWATARNHRWSTHTHWRSGVFLHHEDSHEALLSFASRQKQLSITVRGEYPPHFMHLLQDGLELLIRERWPYLDYALYVPCLTIENGHSCSGRFPLKTLHKARAKGIRDLHCQNCLEEIGVGRLLEGYAIPTEPLSHRLAEILIMLKEAKTDRQLILAQSAEMTRRVLRTFLDMARNGPRLFTLSPIDPAKRYDPDNLLRQELRLTLWCEHPGHEHKLEGKEGQYTIKNPRRWVKKIAPYALLALKVLRVAAPLAVGAVGVGATKDSYKPAFDFMEKLAKSGSVLKSEMGDAASRIDHLNYPISRAEGEGLRAFHDLLTEVGWKPSAANLRRISDKKTGDVLWVCPTHYKEYDPGLPELPEQI